MTEINTPSESVVVEPVKAQAVAVRVKAADKVAVAEKAVSDKSEPADKAREKAKLFRWNGKAYEEVVFEDNHDRRVPMIEEAFQAAIEIRKQVQARTRMRPDLSVVTSALVMVAIKHPDVIDEVARYGLELFDKAAQKSA